MTAICTKAEPRVQAQTYAVPLRILQVNDLGAGGAGAESHLFALRDRQLAAGHDVHLFAHPGPLPAGRSLATWWSRAQARRMRRVLRDFDPDVVHVHNAAALSPAVVAACSEHRARVICTLHDYRHLLDQRLPGMTGPTRGPLHAALERTKIRFVRTILRKHVDVFVCPSRSLAERTAEWAPCERILHLPYPIALPPEIMPAGADGGLLFAGRLEGYKGLHTLRAALARCPEGLRVRIAGEGPLRETCAGEGRFELLGRLSRDEVQAELRRARALVVPSEWLENYPLSVLEAQAEGRAVLASRAGGLPEMVQDGVSGLLVPPFDAEALAVALQRLAGDLSLCQRLGAGGRARVERENDPAAFDRALFALYRGS